MKEENEPRIRIVFLPQTEHTVGATRPASAQVETLEAEVYFLFIEPPLKLEYIPTPERPINYEPILHQIYRE